ncbi:DUF3857 domain-containing protein [Shewanella sp. WXL01]|uniref:DUF3857 domain-containing protein n=1 Tax=Shewanella sp. WXL01 TaxID=2709721 RepID=UPI0014384701|nr:DUF3857 domain-containing protein [Shewanella sp. WXL01]NKF51453.1 DUF3857 domain-containing protein [Shewanella sp. WXL01]
MASWCVLGHGKVHDLRSVSFNSINFYLRFIALVLLTCALFSVPNAIASTLSTTVSSSVNSSLSRQQLDQNWTNSDYRDYGLTQAPQPSWVKPNTIDQPQTRPDHQITNGVYYLLVDNQYKVTDNQTRVFNHFATQATNSKGLEATSQIDIEYDPFYEKLELHQIRIHRGNQVIDKTRTSQFTLTKADTDSDLIYDGTMRALWVVDDVRRDDIVEYSYSLIGQNPVYQNQFSRTRTLQWNVPVHKQSIRVQWHKSEPLSYRLHNSVDEFIVSQHSDYVDYQLTVSQQSLAPDLNDSPQWYKPFAWVEFAQTSNWEQIGKWAAALFEQAANAKPTEPLQTSIASTAEKLTAPYSKTQDKVMALIDFVQQDIRYLGIEMGVNSHLPASPADTLTRRYGDCKDKSLLLVELLKQINVKASPVLVNTTIGPKLDTYLPAANLFDHAIVNIQVNGVDYWVDATRQNQGKDLTSLYLPDYGHVLVADEHTQALTKLPAAPERQRIVFKEVYDLSKGLGETGELTVETKYFGAQAERIRNQLQRKGLNKLASQYQDYYQGLVGELEESQPLSFVDDDKTNQITATEHYRISQPWVEDEAAEEPGEFYFYAYENQITSYLTPPKGEPRLMTQAYPLSIKGELIVNLDDRNWSFEDETIDEQNEFFDFNYQVSFQDSNNQLRIEYQYKHNTDVINPEKFDQWVSALKRVDKYASYGLVSYERSSSDTAAAQTAATDTGSSEQSLPWWVEDLQMWILAGMLALLLFVYALVSLIIDEEVEHESVFYPVSISKFVLLTILTLGIYPYYWHYKNWQYIKKQDSPTIMPFFRAFFGTLWFYPLFAQINKRTQESKSHKFIPLWLGAILALLLITVTVADRYFDESTIVLWVTIVVTLPLVIHINGINGANSSALKANSRWRPRNYIMVLMLPLFAMLLAMDIKLLPSDKIVSGEDLWGHDIEFIRDNGLLAEDQKPIYFYSNDFLSNRNDGNGITETGVFSYWVEEDELRSEQAKFAEITDVEVYYPESNDENTEVTVYYGDKFLLLYLSSIDKLDKKFVELLEQRWQQANAQELSDQLDSDSQFKVNVITQQGSE